ncbi:MAG: PQQ-binding-like beta-propeller repeat protein [Rubripirellula sp.]
MPAIEANESWTAFRGPQGDGIVHAKTNLPSEWSSTENVAWRIELPGNGWSSPVEAQGKLYVSAAVPPGSDQKSGKEFTLSLLIIDADSGDLLKNVAIMDQTADRSPKVHKKNSHASPTPIIDGDRIYVHFGYQGSACLSLQGDVIWKNRDLYFKPTHGNGGTPVLVGNRLIFTCDGDKEPKVVALDAETGKLAWETRRPLETKKTFSFCTPTVIEVDGVKQVIAPGSDCVLALDPQNGEIIWDVRYTGYSVVPKPVYDRGLVFVSTSFDNSKLLAIRPTGKGVVTDTHVEWQADRNVPKTPSMIAHEGLVYSISDNGIAMCLDGETGEQVYQKRVGGNFSASPMLAGDLIYYTSEEGLTTVIQTGREFKKIAENDTGERTLASLGVVGDSLLLRTEDALYRIGGSE